MPGEFAVIDRYFKNIRDRRDDVRAGIGDDAALLRISEGCDLLVSTDTLVSGVHFLPEWNAYDIACKAVMVNISDIAAMGGDACWISLALTMPEIDTDWLEAFSKGLQDSVLDYDLALVGGDTTRGPLSITITIQGQVPKGQAVRRSGAQPGDSVFVSGDLGAAAFAIQTLNDSSIKRDDEAILMQKLHHPVPGTAFVPYLRQYASAAIDISDGLAADLHHICESSEVGASLIRETIPVHPLVRQYTGEKALDLALHGGDDYQLCFTVAADKLAACKEALNAAGLACTCIGQIEKQKGLRLRLDSGEIVDCNFKGYTHF